MKIKKLLNSSLFLTAIGAIILLLGLPFRFHFTAARFFLCFLIIISCAVWTYLNHTMQSIAKKQNTRALIFQFCLFLPLLLITLMDCETQLIQKEGLLYSIGAFLHQAKPFFCYLIVLSACIAILLVITLRKYEAYPIRILFTENHLIPEIVLVFVSCVFVYGAFLPLRDNYYPSHDYSIFAYIGQQILRGKMPYTELWDHKPPLIFYINAVGLKISGGSLAGIWLLEFAAFFTGSLILLHILKKNFPAWVCLPVTCLGILHYVRVFDFGNYTEEISLFLALCSLGLYYSSWRKQHNNLSGLLNGLLCGLAFTCKQNTIGCWSALFFLDFIRILQNKKRREDFLQIIAYWIFSGIGFVLINTAWIIYFAAHDALSAYWDVAFRFNFIYSEQSTESKLACAWTTLSFLPSVSPFLFIGFLGWVPACFQLLSEKKQKFENRIQDSGFRDRHTILHDELMNPDSEHNNNSVINWALISLPIELILAGLSGMNYQHYFILCLTPVFILLCNLIDHLTRNLSYRKWMIQMLIIMTLCLCTLPISKYFAANYMHRTPSSYTKTRDFLKENTVENKSILVWGSRTAIYVMSERYAPTAYFNERPLYLFPDEVQTSQWDELLNNIIHDQPQTIIYTHDSALPFISFKESECILPQAADYAIPIYRYFCENYHYDTTINPEFNDAWDIYVIN